MPTNAKPGTNEFRCTSCGRHFNTEEELRTHAVECDAAKASQPHREEANLDAENDRTWKSVP